MRKSKQAETEDISDININDLLNEETSSDDEDDEQINKYKTQRKALQESEDDKMRRMLMSNDTPQDLNDKDMQQMDEELTMKYSENFNKKKLMCESSDESSQEYQYADKKQMLDDICQSSGSDEEEEVDRLRENKQTRGGTSIEEIERILEQEDAKPLTQSSLVEASAQSRQNLGFDIDVELKKAGMTQILEPNNTSAPQQPGSSNNTAPPMDNILKIIEKKEKANEQIPDAIMQQSNQLLSFDNRFYNVKNTLFMFEEYVHISRKLHEKTHQFYGIVKCIQVVKNFLFVGNSLGIIRVFDIKSQKEMKPLMDNYQLGTFQVTSIDIQEDGGLLLAAYANGSLVLWDLVDYKLIKVIPNMHGTMITNAKIYNIQNSASQIQIISCEDQGSVKWIELNKRAIFGGYSITSEYLFREKMKDTSSIAIYKKHRLYPHEFCEDSKLVAFGGSNLITICTMDPIDGLHTVSRPTICNEKSIPYIAWGFGLTPSQRESTVPIFAFAWDKLIQLIYINEEGTSLEIDGFYLSDKQVISLYFIGDSILFALFEKDNTRESKILYTTKFYPGTYHQLEESKDVNLFTLVSQVSQHAVLEKNFEIYPIQNQVLNSSIKTYCNSITNNKENILFLGQSSIQRAKLFSWEEYIDFVRNNGGYDWLSVLKVALEIYNGDLKGYGQVPDQKDVREALLKSYMKDLLKTSIQTVILKMKQSQLRYQKSEFQPEQIAIKVAIEFCLNIDSVDFLFIEIFDLFDQNGLRQKMFENLEPFIISGQFKKETIPETILIEFLDNFEKEEMVYTKQKNLERVICQLDLRQYSMDLRARLEILCQSNCMTSSLIYLQRSLSAQDCVIMTMFKLMKKIDEKEQKMLKQNSVYPFQQRDIYALNQVDSKQQYEMEKSKCYIGYKILWIIDLYLQGRQFPFGSLSQMDWKRQVLTIANYTINNKESIIDSFLDFDSKCFLEVMQKLFVGQSYQFLDQQILNKSQPKDVLDHISKAVQLKAKKQQTDMAVAGEDNSHPPIMNHYYSFILNIQVSNSEYIQKLHTENKKQKKQESIQVRELILEYDDLMKAIKHKILILLHQKTFDIDEQNLLIQAIKSLSRIRESSNILDFISENDPQHNLIKVRIYLLEQKGDYLQSFKLNMRQLDNDIDIFKWIDTKFEMLSVDTVNQDARLGQLKSAVASQMKELIEIDAQKAIELIDNWYDNSYSDQLIIGELQEFPTVQFNFLLKFLHFNEMEIKLSILESSFSQDKDNSQRFLQYICLFVRLLCSLIGNKEVSITEEVIEGFVKKEYFPIDQCLQICTEYNQHRAIAALLERNGQLVEAINMNMKHLNNTNILEMGKQILKLMRDIYQRQLIKKKGAENKEWAQDVQQLIMRYGQKYEFQNCYYYTQLNSFDSSLKQTCILANKAAEQFGSETWFNVLLSLGDFQASIKQKLEQFQKQNNKEYNDTCQFFTKNGLDIKNIEDLINDFILKRKAYIIITYSTFNISAQDSLDKLGLDLRSIQYIFDFKLKDNKMEKRLMKLANKLICKEILVATKIKKNNVLQGLQLEGDHSSQGGIWDHIVQQQMQKDVCDICQHDLIKVMNKGPLKIFIQCGHTFHQYCINVSQKQHSDQPVKLTTCPKCSTDNYDIQIENFPKKGVSSRKYTISQETDVNQNNDGQQEKEQNYMKLNEEKTESLKEQYLDMFDQVAEQCSLSIMDFEDV